MTLTINGVALLAYLLAAVRILGWIALAPPFNSKSIPNMAKVTLALGLSFAIAPTLAKQPVPQNSIDLVVVALTQVLIGAAMGFVTQLLFDTIAAAGSIIDVLGGFQVAAAFDPLSFNVNSVFGKFHSQLAVMLLFASGGHLMVIGGLLKTFEFVPLMTFPDITGWGDAMTTAMSMFFSVALQIALPLGAVFFITDLALALLTKVSPALNAMSMMYPAKIGLTLLLVGMSFPALPEATSRITDLIMQAMNAMAGSG
ncbi:MAG: flagellar biosynthetic protein FliR [Nocardioides sp.]|uniref:flagellar biosynthetic protein FliR n=1 Tax=Nocardioides nematodiphilus TaxID=2849669 RepID=UPI001CD98A04|nr:flagellar biosynthetic protein FliR [Nocardioides nematodiphilus]MCA1984284.1 flagellar biosynthetic protein FliR [Nocardioides nematodiphilus]